jgi:predicted acyl esterase
LARIRAAAAVAFGALVVGLVVSVPSSEAAKPARHHVRQVVPFAVTNPNDKTVVRGHVYLPDTATGKRIGTVLTLSPYWSDSSALARSDKTIPAPFDWFLADGYAVAAVSLRGTGGSDGCMDFGGRSDQVDAYQVVEGLAKQPWSNGKIGMFGGSYEGWTQSMAVATHPPHLAALVPVSSITDYWNLFSFNGAPLASGPATWPTLVADTNNPACPSLATEHAAEQEMFTSVDADRDAYFRQRYYLDDYAKSSVPVFVTNGIRPLRIYNEGTGVEGDGHILQIENLWRNLPKGNRQMLIGDWSHGYPAPLGMSEQQADAMFKSMLSRWYANYLGDRPARSGLFDSVIYQDDQGGFHTSSNWPPNPRMTRLPLSGTALLATGSHAATGTSQFLSGENWNTPPEVVRDPGPANCGPTQLVYMSAPVSKEVHLAGNWVADLNLESTVPGGHLVALLYTVPTVQPRLQALPTEDLCTTPGVRELGRAITSLRQWRYTGTGDNFPVLVPTRVPLRSQPFATVVHPGERIVLVVAAHHSSVFTSPFKPVLTVHTGVTGGSALVLPVVGAPLRLAQ